jgi:hypothetical protein
MFVALFAPEFVVFTAIFQWRMAKASINQLNETPKSKHPNAMVSISLLARGTSNIEFLGQENRCERSKFRHAYAFYALE